MTPARAYPKTLRLDGFTARLVEVGPLGHTWRIHHQRKQVGLLYIRERPIDLFGFSICKLRWAGPQPDSSPKSPHYGIGFDGYGFHTAREAFEAFVKAAQRLIAWRQKEIS